MMRNKSVKTISTQFFNDVVSQWFQLGEIVYKHAKEYGIPEESLSKEYKEAEDLYVKKQAKHRF